MASLYIHPKSKNYYLDWQENGKRKRKSLGNCSTSDAEYIRKRKELELLSVRNGLTEKKLQKILFKDFAREYLNWFEAEKKNIYRTLSMLKNLEIFFNQTYLSDIDVLAVEQFKQSRKKVKNSTINRDLNLLGGMLTKAINWGYLKEKPKITKLMILDSKPLVFFTKKELDDIYEARPDFSHFWKFIANTGMRRAEAYQLKWEQVSENWITIISTETERTKSGKWRKIPINKAIKECLKKFDNHKGYLFPIMNHSNLGNMFRRTCEKAGMPKKSRDSFIASYFCSHLIMNGVNIRSVQVLMGHSSIIMTERAHLSPTHLSGVMDGFGL